MKHIGIVIFCCVLFMISCRKPDVVVPTPTINKEFFGVSENNVKNGDVITFTLNSVGAYTLTMVDTVQNQVITRERFTGKLGTNTLKLYTNTLPTKYLSVVLKDQNNNQIGKTKIIITN